MYALEYSSTVVLVLLYLVRTKYHSTLGMYLGTTVVLVLSTRLRLGTTYVRVTGRKDITHTDINKPLNIDFVIYAIFIMDSTNSRKINRCASRTCQVSRLWPERFVCQDGGLFSNASSAPAKGAGYFREGILHFSTRISYLCTLCFSRGVFVFFSFFPTAASASARFFPLPSPASLLHPSCSWLARFFARPGLPPGA